MICLIVCKMFVATYQTYGIVLEVVAGFEEEDGHVICESDPGRTCLGSQFWAKSWEKLSYSSFES